MHLVDHLRVPAQPIREPLGKLEAQIEAMSPDVEEQVAGRVELCGRSRLWAPLGSTVKTRKIAASVSGLRTACGSAASTSRRTLRNRISSPP
jgi:hypothetical protein